MLGGGSATWNEVHPWAVGLPEAGRRGVDRARFAELVEPILDDLWRFALRLERDGARAEDLVQTSVLKAMERLDQLREEGRFKSWCLRILYRTWQHQIEKRSEVLQEPEIVDRNPLEQPLQDAVAERVRLGEVLSRALDRLPEDQRAAVWLVDVQDLGFREAADVLGVPFGTVASRVARGRAQLRAWLGDVARAEGVIR